MIGLSRSTASESVEVIRGGSKISGEQYASFSFLQFAEFDNSGAPRNGAGNLLMLNRGSSSTPAVLYNLATQGPAFDSGTGESIYTFSSPSNEQIDGMAVSPNNSLIAMTSVTNNDVVVLNYTSGASVGTGAGASASFSKRIGGVGLGGGTEGAAWLDDNTLLVMRDTGVVVKIDDVAGATPTVSTAFTPTMAFTSGYTDMEYVPSISPYVFAVASQFASSTTTNTLFILDPANSFALVDELDFSSAGTAREIGLTSLGDLIVGGFGTTLTRIAGVADGAVDTADITAGFYDGINNASFPGIAVATSIPEPASLALLGAGLLAVLSRRRVAA